MSRNRLLLFILLILFIIIIYILWPNAYTDALKTLDGLIMPFLGGYDIVGNIMGYAGDIIDYVIGYVSGIYIFAMKLMGEMPLPVESGVGERAAMSAAAIAVGGGIAALSAIGGAKAPGQPAPAQPDGGTSKKSVPEKLWDFVHGFFKGQFKSLIFRQESKIHNVEARQHQAFFLGISSLEWLIGGFAALALAVAYIVAKKAVLTPDLIVLYLVTACIVTGLHDLTHRYFAFKYKAVTEYQFWGLGFIAMFATAFLFGQLYGMPARTLVNKAKDLKPEESAIVYGSGPVVSFAASLIFLALAFFGGPLASVGVMGVSMNLLSATYSLMPFKNMDGNKLYSYNKLYWALAFLPVLAIYFAAMIYLL
jgi:hypothetical protein